jgi:hypothetical protein
MTLRHERKVSITATYEVGDPADRVIYQPGTLEALDTLKGYRYSGRIIALELYPKIQGSNLLRLWIRNESDPDKKLILGDELKIFGDTKKVNLLEVFANQSQINLSEAVSLGITIGYPARVIGQDTLTILGFAEEEGLAHESPSISSPSQGGFLNCKNQQIQLIMNSSALILPKNSNRIYAAFINNSDVDITLALGISTDLLGQGIILKAFGGSYEINALNLYLGAISAICEKTVFLSFVECTRE